MGLRDLYGLKVNYNSDKDDVLNGFYIPVLRQSVEYYRLAGFFSSSALAVAARGIKGLLENKGKIKLIAGAILNRDDVIAIRDGLEKPSEVIQRNFIEDINNIGNKFERNHVQALGWMVANDKLDIRIAILKDNEGYPVDIQSAAYSGIFHQKIGIFKDNNGDKISFSGSINETGSAWRDNIEQFKVFRGWMDGERDHFNSDYETFYTYWDGESERFNVMDVPDAIRQNLIKFAPKDIGDLNLNYQSFECDSDNNVNNEQSPSKKYNILMTKDIVKLRDYQKEALENWKINNYRGILEMATGSGKTFTAILGSYFLYKRIGKLATIIIVPSKQLVNQWGDEIRKYTNNIALISSNIKNWKANINDYIYLFNHDEIDHLYIITTIQSYIKTAKNLILNISSLNKLLIIDEAHWIGAEGTQNCLKGIIPIYNLGLTATPIRYFDEAGTKFLSEYLGNVIFSFTINDGQNRGFLCKYNYHIEFCELNSNELRKYINLSKSIIKLSRDKNEDKYKALLNRRAKIIKDANSKMIAFERKIANLDNIKNCVIYCDENQIEQVCNILCRYDIVFNTFLGDTNDQDRQALISRIKSGSSDAIVAIKCLNEGVDIPPLRMGFFISNSGNPREFIQRRGRLLRVCKGKSIVDMYDFVVVPDTSSIDEANGINIDNIVTKELNRVKEFNDNALNSAINERKILEELDKII